MIREVCNIRGWWRSLASGAKVGGHTWVQGRVYANCTVIEERCETCGREHVVWHPGEPREWERAK